MYWPNLKNVTGLFGWHLAGSLPARQHHPAAGDQNQMPKRAAYAKQLCQGCNQRSPSASFTYPEHDLALKLNTSAQKLKVLPGIFSATEI
jgi:hypothetical protein